MAETLLIPARFALYADLMALFGLVFFPLYALGSDSPLRLPLRGVALGGALSALALSALLTWLLVANMAGVGLAEVDRGSLDIVLFETAAGKAVMGRAGFLVALLTLGLRPGPFGRLRTAGAAGLSAAALATLGWGGHAAAQEGAGASLYLAADIVHLLAGAIWFGALIAFTGLLLRASPAEAEPVAALQAALARFSLVGTLLVAAILATGLVNSWALVGIDHVSSLVSATYGRVLLAKIGLFAAMLGLAALNRFRLTPALGRGLAKDDAAPALASLKRSLALETAAALAIVALVAWLGTLSPIAEG